MSRFSYISWVLALVFATSGQAHAQAFDFRLFRPTTHANGTASVESGEISQDIDLRTGLFFDYGRRPLQALDAFGNVVAGLVVDRIDARLMAAVAYGGRVSFSLELPITLFQSGDLSPLGMGRLASTVGGDMSISPKIGILQRAQFGLDLALLGFLTVPTGNRRAFAGNPDVTGGAELDASRYFGPVFAGLNLGGYVRRRQTFLDLRIGPELFTRFALALDLERTNWQVPVVPFFEIYGRTSAVSPFQDDSANQLEANLGVRVSPLPWLELAGGYARSLSGGVGSAVQRFFMSVMFTPLRVAPEDRPPPPRSIEGLLVNRTKNAPPEMISDRDGDGIPNEEDKCPDRLGPKDKKGCPFLDTDMDGIEDNLDKCPTDVGPTKNYGCPLKDGDGDGFDDPVDSCPTLPEDKDGFQDTDGCPDDDNDQDGIADYNDKCPNSSEIINGVDDYDGCPDNGRALVLLTPTGIELRERVNFKPGTEELDWKAPQVLRQVVALMVNHKLLQLTIESHLTDATPAAAAKELTEKRADVVRQFLVTAGIDIRRLRAAGFGSERPLVPHTSSKAKQLNERIGFSIRTPE